MSERDNVGSTKGVEMFEEETEATLQAYRQDVERLRADRDALMLKAKGLTKELKNCDNVRQALTEAVEELKATLRNQLDVTIRQAREIRALRLGGRF